MIFDQIPVPDWLFSSVNSNIVLWPVYVAKFRLQTMSKLPDAVESAKSVVV